MLDGFILDENKWDSLPLDGLLLLQIHKQTQGRLERAGYLGFESSMEKSQSVTVLTKLAGIIR